MPQISLIYVIRNEHLPTYLKTSRISCWKIDQKIKWSQISTDSCLINLFSKNFSSPVLQSHHISGPCSLTGHIQESLTGDVLPLPEKFKPFNLALKDLDLPEPLLLVSPPFTTLPDTFCGSRPDFLIQPCLAGTFKFGSQQKTQRYETNWELKTNFWSSLQDG